jgi:anti-sigma B factor antagonist
VPLSIQTRRIGDIVVMTCLGQIVEGQESTALSDALLALIPRDPRIVLNLGGVDFIDSSGLGLLVRFVVRTRVAHGHLTLCAMPAKLRTVLEITRLTCIFESFDSETAAIAACYQPAGPTGAPYQFRTDVLSVVPSHDVQHYVREVLAQAGYGVITAGNLPDALTLLQATRPRAVVISADLRALRSTPTAEAFNSLVNADTVVELETEFSSDDAGAAGQHLLDQVRDIVGQGTGHA